jgi:molybdate transport system ATP-binding protein
LSLRLDFAVRLATFSLRVDTTIDDGSTVAIIGANGAGKTTLLKTIAGLMPVDEGRIVLDDRVLDAVTEKRDIGVVFQDYLLFDHLSMLENVAFGPRARGVRAAEAREHARQMIASVGMADLLERRPRELSGGQRQRVALLRALAIRPRVLLLDEPLAAIDAAARPELRASLVERIADFDGTTLVVSHDPSDVAAMADRVIVLESGRVVWDGPVTDDGWRPR